MRSLWSDGEAEAIVARYGESGIGLDLGLRVYTSRCSASRSGWDMGNIEPAGLPAVRLAPLRRLRERDALSDEEMVRIQRANLLDPGAPNPSVETLLHAFLPHKFIDHTHATAVLSLADQPDAAERLADLYGPRVGIVPYIMPGFLLAKKAAEIYEAGPGVEGLVLLKHGVFSFGETAREAYERMIAIVTLAEEHSRAGARASLSPLRCPRRWRARLRSRQSCAAPAPYRMRWGPIRWGPIRRERVSTSGSCSISAPAPRC